MYELAYLNILTKNNIFYVPKWRNFNVNFTGTKYSFQNFFKWFSKLMLKFDIGNDFRTQKIYLALSVLCDVDVIFLCWPCYRKSTEISRSESLKGRQDQKGRIKQRRVKRWSENKRMRLLDWFWHNPWDYQTVVMRMSTLW